MTADGSISVTTCTEKDKDLWDEYVYRSPDATMCHLYAWRSIIEGAYGHESFYVMARVGHEGAICGVLPLILVRNRLLGVSLVSMPFLDYGGICADDERTAELLLKYAFDIKHTVDAQLLELRQARSAAGSLSTACHDKVGMMLDLSGGEETLWRSLPAKVRNQVRKAQRSGLQTRTGGIELLDAFYDVFAVNMRDLGSPVHSHSFFAHMCAAFGLQLRVMLVQDGIKTVGGLVALFYRDTMLVPWASSLRAYFSKCPNNLLYWNAIQTACARGCAWFDFGRSSMGSGTYEFKRQWGAKPIPLGWALFGNNGPQGTTISANDATFRILSEVWRRLPLSLTKLVGPQVRKYLTN